MAHDRYMKSDIQPFFERYGWTVRPESGRRIWDAKTKRWRWISGAEKSQPDLMCIKSGAGIFVEAKCFQANSWQTKEWGPNQRQWMEEAQERGESCWFALLGGVNPPNYNPEKYQPRRFWLVYTMSMLALVKRIEQTQFTIPYQLNGGKSHYKSEVRSQNLCLVEWLEDYEIPYIGGAWTLPSYHPFYKGFYRTEMTQHA